MAEISRNSDGRTNKNGDQNSLSVYNVSIADNDPFFISKSDQTIGKLVVVNLNGNNFINWKRNVRRALITKNKLGFIEGSIAKPNENDSDFNRWVCCHYLVICWLENSMKEDIGENFSFFESSAGEKFVSVMDNLMFHKFTN